MHRERKKGLEYSSAMHILVLLIIVFDLTRFLPDDPPVEPAAITVELLPITGITNVKPMDSTPSEQPKQEAKAEEKPPTPPVKADEPKKPSPPVQTKTAPPPPPADAVPLPKKDEKKPDKKEEQKPTPDPKKDDAKDKKKAKPEDLDAILKAVKETAQKNQKQSKPDAEKTKDAGSPSKSISNKYDASQPMSLSEKDAIMGQFAKCWSPPAGAKDAHDLVVIIDAEFDINGGVIKAELADSSRSRANNDTFFRAAAESALRAVRQCSPLKNLPQDKFSTWGVMELHFDPRDMLQ